MDISCFEDGVFGCSPSFGILLFGSPEKKVYIKVASIKCTDIITPDVDVLTGDPGAAPNTMDSMAVATHGRRRISVTLVDAPKRSEDAHVAWYPGTPPDAIELAIRGALGLPMDAAFYGTESSSGCVVIINEWLPDGTALAVRVVEDRDAIAERDEERERAESLKVAEHAPLLTGALAAPTAAPADAGKPSEAAFRGQLLKFERINAHLANERTWLAWMRTALSLVSCAFAILDYADGETVRSWSLTYFVVGCLFIACVDLTWLTGWFRYKRTKEILAIPKEKLPKKFDRFRMKYQAQLLGVLLAILPILYVSSGWRSVFYDDDAD